MVPTRYPASAGLLAGLVTLRDRLIGFVFAWTDPTATALATYYSATRWLAFLLVPVAALAVGYAGGRAASGDPDPDLPRVGLVGFAIGVVASALALGVAVLLRPESVSSTAGLPLRAVQFSLALVEAPALAAVAAVAGVALGADRGSR
ncbi:hypothetical protein [Halorarum halobium]|uniref:hypothetical protein n=1 Tax=Halorarum halobium TaxID=3075121 RepID=UPI0028A8F137|nr:hypothetical protein [Halobaculum sp. XH14]